MLEMEIQHMANSRDSATECFLFLRVKDPSDRRICPIVIGINEATAIAAPSRDPSPRRPMTHDLLLNSINDLGGVVQYVYVRELSDTTFFADIAVKFHDELLKLDARPSDAVALAVRARVPIYIAEDVIDRVSRDLEVRSSDDESGGRRKHSRHRMEESSSPVTPEEKEKLSAYSDLMETLSLDDDGQGELGTEEKAK